MIKPVREDISEIFIVVKGGQNFAKLDSFVKWIPNNLKDPNNLPKISVVDEVPYNLSNKARYLLVLHYSALDRRMSSNVSDFVKRYVDQGFLVCYIGEKRFGINDNLFEREESKLKEKNIQTEIGISKKIADLMVDVSYEQGTLDNFSDLETYLKKLLPKKIDVYIDMNNQACQ